MSPGCCSGLCLAGSTARIIVGCSTPGELDVCPPQGMGHGHSSGLEHRSRWEHCDRHSRRAGHAELPCLIYRPAGLALPPICLGFHFPGINQPEAFDPTTAYKQGGLKTARAGARQGLLFPECYSGLRNICLCEGPGLEHVWTTRRD